MTLAAGVRTAWRRRCSCPALTGRQTTVTSPPVGVMSRTLDRGLSGLALPLIDGDLFVGLAVATPAPRSCLPRRATATWARCSPAAAGTTWRSPRAAGRRAPGRGHRGHDRRRPIPRSRWRLGAGLLQHARRAPRRRAGTGARCHLRPHVTLARLQQMLTPGLAGARQRPARGRGGRPGGRPRSSATRSAPTARPGGRPGAARTSATRSCRPTRASWSRRGRGRRPGGMPARVRTNAFRKNLVRGLQSFATGFPLDLSPAQIGAAAVPGRAAREPAGPATTCSCSPTRSSSSSASRSRGSCSTCAATARRGARWPTPTDVASRPILGATSLILVRRINPDPSYRIPSPVAP